MHWAGLTVAPAGTHHLKGDVPAYEERFDEVLKFHAPGLAPVRRGGQAWHIRSNGEAAYNARFRRTFGFYEGLAVVEADDGAFHVGPTGEAAYPLRYLWCGNFQEGRCPVRDSTGAYYHITAAGEPAYEARWCYAGDFRDGVAVVQSDRGTSTHIDVNGREIHGVWFEDLDVFHKGFARAKDASGWLHIDLRGQPVYSRRFALVEPFYNGQARVETFGGSLEVIDEAGRTTTVLRPPTRSEFANLSGDMVGFWRTQTIASAVELGLPDALPAATGEIARSLELNEERLARLLRALGELNIVEAMSGVWRLTERGQYLRRDHPFSLAHAAVEYGSHFPKLWIHLAAAIRRYGAWTPPDIFSEVAANPSRAMPHHRMLQSYACHDYAEVPAALALSGHERLIDAGGGLGVLAGALLDQYPDLTITLLDRPEVIESASREHRHSTRISWRSGDFFSDWGLAADVVVLARILHDWDDSDALRLLVRARQSLDAGGRLFVVEMILSEDDPGGGLCDLHLLMVTGGRERTLSQFQGLLSHAGFAMKEVRRLRALPVILVAEAI